MTLGPEETGSKGPEVRQWSNVKVQVQAKFTRDSPGCHPSARWLCGGSEVGHSSETADLAVTLHWPDCVPLSCGLGFLLAPSINLRAEKGGCSEVKGSWRGTIKPAHTVNGQHCCVLREEAWIYEAEPDWVVNLTRWARGCGHSLPLCWPYSPPRMPRCIHWARVMPGSREAAAGLLRLVNALTGVGIQRPSFRDQKPRSGAK